MRRVPVVACSVLVATVATTVAIEWRARRSVDLDELGAVLDTRESERETRVVWALPSGAAPVARGTRMLHGDSRHTGREAGKAPSAAPEVVWSRNVGGPVEAQIVTSPDEETFYVASLGGSLSALSRADGAVKWTVDLGDRAYATPCVADDGTIYAGSDAKKIVALTPAGRTKWTVDTEDEADTGLVLSKDGTVVFAAGRRVFGVTALGFVKWRFSAKRKVYTSPAIGSGGRIFFGSQDHHVYALTSEGGPEWSTNLGFDVDGAPIVGDDGAVYVGTDGDEVARLDPNDGHVVWRSKVGGYVRGTLSMTRTGAIAAGVYGPAPRQVLLGEADGRIRLSFPIHGTGAREFGIHGGAVEDDSGVLLFGAQDDFVRAIDQAGNLLWKFAARGDVDVPVTLVSDGGLVFGSDDGNVYLLRGN